MAIPIFQVDAFTDQPFGGNPAAVCLLDGDGDESWMQSVAAEMNLAETAFVRSNGDHYGLRWFTPLAEVDLCGHATLAAAHILWETATLADDQPARFETRSGMLTARRDGQGITMDFPSTPPAQVDPPDLLLASLGLSSDQVRWVGRSDFDYFVEVADQAEVEALAPDFRRLAQLPVRGVIVTSRAAADADIVSRFFAPAFGIDEDPATGSAHCCLGPYWAAKLAKTELSARQLSRRGAYIRVRVNGDRVDLIGQAVTVFRGEWLTTNPQA